MPNWRLPNRPFAEHLGRVLKHFDIDCVLDVGANDGGFARFLRLEVGYRGLIISFEPVSVQTQACLAAAAIDPLWHVYGFGLGNKNCTTEMNAMANSVFNSLLQPIDNPPREFADMMVVDHKETIELRRLENLLPKLKRTHQFARPYLKIDTQGFDLAVIEGAGSSIDQIIALQTELLFQPIYRDMPSWSSVTDALRDRDFSVSNFFMVNADPMLRAIELDGVFINNRHKQ